MDEVFQGLKLELVIAHEHYEVEKACLDKNNKNKLLLVVPAYKEPKTPTKGELIISDVRNVCITEITFLEQKTEDNKTIFVCSMPQINAGFFKRCFLRLKTNIPLEYFYMKTENDNDVREHSLVPISAKKKGTIRDLSPTGACIEVSSEEFPLLKDLGSSPVYIKLCFQLNDEERFGVYLELLGQVVNLKKSWSTDQIGVLFINKSYEQHRMLELYCHKNAKNIEEAQDKLLQMIKPLSKF